MKSYRLLRGLKIVVVVIVAVLLFGLVTMHLWNWLMPAVFGLTTITFTQALGLLVLSKILFGGFHRHHGRGGWRRHMEERFQQMTPEEHERFRAGMRGRRGCGFGPRERAPEQSSQQA
jgi:chromate transport protein ChrA